MAEKETKTVKPTKAILTAVALIIMFLGGKIFPTWGPLTELGVAMVCAFVGLIMLITVTNDLIWPPCAALLAIIFWGYLDATTAIFNFIGTTVIVQMIILLVICDALRQTGAGEVLAKKLLKAKWIQGKPLLLSAALLIIFTIADIVLTTFGGLLFSYAVLDSIGEAAGYKKNDKYMQAMSVGLYLASMLGASVLPFGGMVLGITNAFSAAVAESGATFNPAIYIVCAIVVSVVFMILYALCMRVFMKADMSKLKDLNVAELDTLQKVSDKFSTEQISYLVAFLVAVAYSFILMFLPKGTPFTTWFSGISQCAWFILVLVVLCLIKVNGKPLMNCAKHFNTGLNWGFIVTVGAFSMLGGALASNDLGFKQWLINVIGPVFSSMSWPVFCLVVIAIVSIVTNFFSNMATGVIVSTLTAPFAMAYAQNGINITVIGSAIAFSSMFAYLTYAAAGPAPLLLGREGVESKFMFTKGIIALPLYIIVATVLFCIFGYIF